MAKTEKIDKLPDKLGVKAIFDQVSDERVIEWLRHSLKHNTGLRMAFLTRFASEVETKDIRTKYLAHCRLIRKKYGSNVGRTKKMTGKKMYVQFNHLLDQAHDQLALENYLECYAIISAIYWQLQPFAEADRLNSVGTETLRRCYKLMNYLSQNQLPPPLLNEIKNDWSQILSSGHYNIYDAVYNPFTLLFRVYEDETALFLYLAEQQKNKSYSRQAYLALQILVNFAQLEHIGSDDFNHYLADVHPRQLKRLFREFFQEKKYSTLKYLLENIALRDKDSYDSIILRNRVKFYTLADNADKAWDSLQQLMDMGLTDQNIRILMAYARDNYRELNDDRKRHLRKLMKTLPRQKQWELMKITAQYEALKAEVLSHDELKDIVPFIAALKEADYKPEVLQHFKSVILNYLETYHGRQSLSYIDELLSLLREYGHRDIEYRLLNALENTYAERPSIKHYLQSKYIG